MRYPSRTFQLARFKLKVPNPSLEEGTGELVDLTSITIRTVTIEDELAAVERAAAAAGSGGASQVAVSEEIFGDAIEKVNGIDVARPWKGLKKWPAKAGSFVRRLFREMNDPKLDEVEEFIAAEFPREEPKASGRGG